MGVPKNKPLIGEDPVAVLLLDSTDKQSYPNSTHLRTDDALVELGSRISALPIGECGYVSYVHAKSLTQVLLKREVLIELGFFGEGDFIPEGLEEILLANFSTAKLDQSSPANLFSDLLGLVELAIQICIGEASRCSYTHNGEAEYFELLSNTRLSDGVMQKGELAQLTAINPARSNNAESNCPGESCFIANSDIDYNQNTEIDNSDRNVCPEESHRTDFLAGFSGLEHS